MAILEVFHLGTDHTFKMTRAGPLKFYPNLLKTKLGRVGMAFATIQDPTWSKSRKVETFETWGELVDAPVPKPDLNAARRAMLVELDNPFPITAQPELSGDKKQGFLSSLMAEYDQYAENLSTRKDTSDVTMRVALVGLVGVIALVSIIMAFVVIQNVWLQPPVPPA